MEVLTAVDHEQLADLRRRDEFFWLDLIAPGEADLEVLADVLELHPAAIEDSHEWGQIPKLDEYDDHVMLVAYSAAKRGDRVMPVEVHVYVSGGFVVTIRREPCPLDGLHAWLLNSDPEAEEEAVYHVLDAIVDGWDPVIADLDERVDVVEAQVLERPRQSHLSTIYRLRQEVVELVRRAGPQSKVLDATADVLMGMPDLSRGSKEWLRDVVTHADATSGELERLAGDLRALTDTFFNANTNRLNRLATLLAVGGSFFLVWTLVTSFFGQNFRWLTDNVSSREDFLVLGIGGLIVPTVLMAAAFYWRRGDWW